jgi:hypothetical protein
MEKSLDVSIRALSLAGVEALQKKISKWNEKCLLTSSYLDPQMRRQLDAVIEVNKTLTKNKVITSCRKLNQICFYYRLNPTFAVTQVRNQMPHSKLMKVIHFNTCLSNAQCWILIVKCLSMILFTQLKQRKIH